MDVLRTAAPSLYSSSGGGVGRPRGGGGGGGEYVGELPGLIGFDWGSCAWRHCGARADAQEAVAELYSNVGMLEPFECRFIIGEHHRRVNGLVCDILLERGHFAVFFAFELICLIAIHAHHS
jgi:hypothetical protein